MRNQDRNEFFSREAIQRLLSDQELASVSTSETAVRLVDGEEYIDLEHLELGVRRADSSSSTVTPMGHVLPRRAVKTDTWREILVRLEERSQAAARPGG